MKLQALAVKQFQDFQSTQFNEVWDFLVYWILFQLTHQKYICLLHTIGSGFGVSTTSVTSCTLLCVCELLCSVSVGMVWRWQHLKYLHVHIVRSFRRNFNLLNFLDFEIEKKIHPNIFIWKKIKFSIFNFQFRTQKTSKKIKTDTLKSNFTTHQKIWIWYSLRMTMTNVNVNFCL